VQVGDEVALKDGMHQNVTILESRNLSQSQGVSPWLDIDRENLKARVVALPRREDVQTPPMNEQLIVELYSK
jgi:small subunit ribosomal protein S4